MLIKFSPILFNLLSRFTIADKFGDIWGGTSRLFIMDSYKRYSVYSPTCTGDTSYGPVVCFDSYANKNGDSVMVALDSNTAFPWEVIIRIISLEIKFISQLNVFNCNCFRYGGRWRRVVMSIQEGRLQL